MNVAEGESLSSSHDKRGEEQPTTATYIKAKSKFHNVWLGSKSSRRSSTTNLKVSISVKGCQTRSSRPGFIRPLFDETRAWLRRTPRLRAHLKEPEEAPKAKARQVEGCSTNTRKEGGGWRGRLRARGASAESVCLFGPWGSTRQTSAPPCGVLACACGVLD